MDLFEKFKVDNSDLGKYSTIGHGYFSFPKLEGEISNKMMFNGKERLVWSVNNYLGLANHPEIRKVDAEAAAEWGLAYPMGARMMSGQTKYHEQLEMELAEFESKEAAYLLNYGYMGMSSIIDALVNRKDVIVYDSESHACILDGMRMHLGKRFVFPHNNIENLEKQLENQLLSHWNYNYKSLINYMEQSLFGLRGILSDSITNVPIKGKIFINGHDMDSSHVYSSLPVGDYHRYLFAGNYNVTYSSPGYKSKTINGINITNDSTTVLDVQLVPNGTGIYQKTDDEIVNIYPNPAKNIFFIEIEKPVGKIFNVELIDTDGRMIYIDHFISYSNTNLSIDVSDFNSGIYFLRLFDNENVYCKKIIIHK